MDLPVTMDCLLQRRFARLGQLEISQGFGAIDLEALVLPLFLGIVGIRCIGCQAGETSGMVSMRVA